MMKVALLALTFLWSASLLGQANTNELQKDTVPRPDTIMSIKSDILGDIPTVTIDADENDQGASSVSSILTAGRDPFLAAAEFNFSPARFSLRGYVGQNNVYLNGVDFSGLDNGFVPFGIWGGLNNVMRSRQTFYGLSSSDFAVGSIGLNTNIDLRASAQWAQTQIGYALSNRNYNHRLTFSHGSGFNKKGWAYSLAFTGRYANEGYVKGTYYRGLSYYAAVDKKLGAKNTISLIAFGAPTENGRQTGSVQETMDLVGSNYYNPAWGYQNGKVRNSNVAETFQPAFLMVHEYKPNNRTSWMTSISYVFGKRKLSAFDWYNAPDPRPDYYRYLPSYYDVTSTSMANNLRDLFNANPELLQVDWHKLYEVNRGNVVTVNNVDGTAGNSITGKRALYILSNRVTDLKRLMANTVFNTKIGDRVALTLGANYQNQVNHYYQEVKDLLGGDFWVNVNQFAERDFPTSTTSMQYDLDKPNRLAKNGDQYGYDYKMNITRGAAWAQFKVNLYHFDFFLASELSGTSFYRTGLNRNGLFPNDSYGNSTTLGFLNTNTKLGVTYKLNGRNYFFLNGAYVTNPPFFENVFISQRTRNSVQSKVESEKIQSAEIGYKHNSPRLKFGLTGYYTTLKNGYDVMTFYHDQYQNFVNYALSGIDQVYFGGELGIDYKLTSTLSVNAAASVGRYYYDSRPHAIVTVDNSAQIIAEQTVYLKNYRVPSTPQNAYSAGFFYRSPKYWYVSVTGNYFHNMWLSVNPLRRTTEAIGDMDPELPSSQEIAGKILAQEKFDGQFTLDFFGGWSKRLPKQYNIHNKPVYLVFNLGVNNILNNQNIRSGGFEQLRFDYENKNINKFPPKYYYAYGLNYFASVAIRFN